MTLNSGPAVWDIFCQVVDNLGDAGVCWRLARQLTSDHGLALRLWIDRLASLQQLWPATDPGLARQRLAGVDVRRWDSPLPREALAEGAGDVVIEAFACHLPDAFVAAMASREPRPPVWINLEYLSAETWVEGCHGLPSPHPKLPLVKYFFFPGFSEKTGGLIREAGLERRRTEYQADPYAQARFWADLALPPAAAGALRVSMFCYRDNVLPSLFETWARGPRPVQCLVPMEQAVAAVSASFGGVAPAPGRHFRRGNLEVCLLPFLPQDDYDRLLWSCDCNFVRGEDSFVRAQWARRPLVWRIYPQTEDTHRLKLDAFLDRYSVGLSPADEGAARGFWHAWNGTGSVVSTWPAFERALPRLACHGESWAERLAALGDLAEKLVEFTTNRLK